jgi:hypothetical protein
MQNVVVTKLRSDFTAAISSDQNDVTLDPSIAGLLDEISRADFSNSSRSTQEATCAKWVIASATSGIFN